mgnify:CR=1 FL=1|tara:strand:+ start:711 stop:1622 length:912 start_codon:yes stop_codon:yes gene_type:complete
MEISNTTKFKTSSFNEEQLKIRRTRIGASEIGRVMSGDWFSLYQEKIGEATVDLSDVFQVQLGIQTEAFNLWWLMKAHPELFDDEDNSINNEIINGIRVHAVNQSGCNILAATPDAYCTIDGVKGVVDCKHTNPDSWGKEKYENAEARVIETYKWQMQQQMLCSSHKIAVISPIYGNKHGPYIIIHAVEEMQQQIIEQATKFWEHVTLGVAPENPEGIEGPKIEHDSMRVIKEDEFKEWNAYQEWCGIVPSYIQTEQAVKQNKSVKEMLKSILPNDVKKLTGNGLTATRNKRGAVSFKYEPQS